MKIDLELTNNSWIFLPTFFPIREHAVPTTNKVTARTIYNTHLPLHETFLSCTIYIWIDCWFGSLLWVKYFLGNLGITYADRKQLNTQYIFPILLWLPESSCFLRKFLNIDMCSIYILADEGKWISLDQCNFCS